jgi:hypothetical protein
VPQNIRYANPMPVFSVGFTPLTRNIDLASATVTYIGEASPGASTADNVWRIMRLTESGTQTLVAWADGTTDMDNVWDNRASLNYS